ncbi:hypothetical protein DRE_07729 [Drechslerella stenobrocha 248]|uniref:NACHT domain-containing protein n=1 Tax=Drechslerella stenobrocha 248 TaxID=1043628 RepID=W7HYE3_9PEZI|nr:hypothetical protein DRE_07729 [Drechslerella stenobrocha 248]
MRGGSYYEEGDHCLRDLRATDPRHDKERIEEAKGTLLKDSYLWVLENAEFKKWRDSERSQLLWIRGDPGKGKTMLLCGIIDQLTGSTGISNQPTNPTSTSIASFFCQATDARINSATAVLRGLIYLLVIQRSELIQHVRREYNTAGEKLFEGENAWQALSKIFFSILQDRSLTSAGVCLIVDALDECISGLPKLLRLIAKTIPGDPGFPVKWIVSSRNWPDIEKDLCKIQGVELRLELNERSVSTAVNSYIEFKVAELTERNSYTDQTRDAVKRYLSLNANGTFLWVALVCQELRNVDDWEAEERLTAFPPELNELYARMMDQICWSNNAKLCKNILAVASQ